MNYEFWNDYAARVQKDYMDNFGKQVTRQAFEVGFGIGKEAGRLFTENSMREKSSPRYVLEAKLENYIKDLVHEHRAKIEELAEIDESDEYREALEKRYTEALMNMCISSMTRADNSIPMPLVPVAMAISTPDKNKP